MADRYYLAYAGRSAPGDAWTYWRWQWTGQDRTAALTLLAAYQQEGFDFCGITVHDEETP